MQFIDRVKKKSILKIIRNETVGTFNITADSADDTAWFTAGTGMTITTFFNNDTVSLGYLDSKYSNADLPIMPLVSRPLDL